MIPIEASNLFTSQCQTLVNTVNCQGVMGKGLALEFKVRFPAMFEEYQTHCRSGEMDIGKPQLYRGEANEPWILNFPTKKHWKFPSKEEYLHLGLEHVVGNYQALGITSIAFPVLGAQNGGLEETQAIGIMQTHLSKIEIPAYIHTYDPSREDDLYPVLRRLLDGATDIGKATGISTTQVRTIKRAMTDVRTVGRLAECKGIGERTMAKLVAYLRKAKEDLAQPILQEADVRKSCIVVAVNTCDGSLVNPNRLRDDLKRALNNHRNPLGALVTIDYCTQDFRGKIALGEHWRVNASKAVIRNLRKAFGPSAVRVENAQ